MRQNLLSKIMVLSLCAAALAACSGGGGGSGDGGSTSQNYKCVPIPDGSVKWTYEECGPLSNGRAVDIRQTTMGDVPSGSGFIRDAIVNYPPLNKGRVTFTVTNMDWTDFPFPEDDIVLLLFMAENDALRETNWHILGSREWSDGRIWTRLIAQRFDGMCAPSHEIPCERKSSKFDMPVYERSKSYKFDCSWDSSADSGWFGSGVGDGLVQCDILDVTDPKNETLIYSHKVPTGGPFEHLNYFCAGGGCGPLVEKINLPTKMTNFRFTLFN